MSTQTPAPQMESNPLQRALDNYLVMEHQCAAARHEAAEVRAANAQLIAEVAMLRDQLHTTEAERRKWEAACATIFGRLLAINDTIAGAVKQAARDGLEAKDEPLKADAGLAAPLQQAAEIEATKTATEDQASQAPPQRVPAAVPMNEFRR